MLVNALSELIKSKKIRWKNGLNVYTWDIESNVFNSLNDYKKSNDVLNKSNIKRKKIEKKNVKIWIVKILENSK